MELAKLQAFAVRIQALINSLAQNGHPANGQLDRLYYDITTLYQPALEAGLGKAYKTAWDESITRRFAAITVHASISDAFDKLRADWKSTASTASLFLYFGQIRVGPNFAGAQNVHQQNIVGLPNLNGQALVNIGATINAAQMLPDEIVVQIFWHNNKWIVANNRGFTAHVIGGVRPLRLVPRPADQMELNRLTDVEGQGEIQRFTGANAHALLVRPHTVPSTQMPITSGPNTFDVQQVVTIPKTWV